MANEIIMNKKGGMAIRDIMFILIIFVAIMGLAGVFVKDMAQNYDNPTMETEYTGSESVGGLSDSMFSNLNNSIGIMKSGADEGASTFGILSGAIKGIPSILAEIIKTPIYIGSALGTLLTALRLPDPIPTIVKNTAIFLIYVIIIFVIASALSRGGTKI